MYEMMCGRLPFYSRDHEKLFEMILMKVSSVVLICDTPVVNMVFILVYYNHCFINEIEIVIQDF